jgi:phenylalanyl-tRNA synthetase beta chain
MASLAADPTGLIRSVHLFDIYKPAASATANAGGWLPGEHSLAVRLELRDDAATLTDERTAAAVHAAVARATQGHGARLRA